MNKSEMKQNPSYIWRALNKPEVKQNPSYIWGGGKVSEQAGGEAESFIWGRGQSMNKLEVKVNPPYGVVAGQ